MVALTPWRVVIVTGAGPCYGLSQPDGAVSQFALKLAAYPRHKARLRAYLQDGGMMYKGSMALVVSLVWLAACGGAQPREEEEQVVEGPAPDAPAILGVDGVACVGELDEVPEGLSEIEDAALMGQALAASEKGGVCTAEVFVAQQTVRVYRVWDSSKDYSKLGRWWAFERPEGPREEYREDYAICPTWSALDRLVACDLKVGAKVVIGTTQSAKCDDGSILEKTDAIQVYIPNDTRINEVHVENCAEEGAWP